MLIRLPNGDLIESSEIARVQALEAEFIPDRVEVELADGSVIVLRPEDGDAGALRDEIAEGIDAAGEVVLDLTPEPDDDDVIAISCCATVICPDCGVEFRVLADATEVICQACGLHVELVEED